MISRDLADIFLLFSNSYIILPLLILGYFLINKKILLQTIYILLITILINIALKALFKIPLSPQLNKIGFAFPSGHMQASFALYGWLFLRMKNLFARIIIALILIAIGYSLVYKGYHNYFDILGAIFFGTLTILLYEFLSRLSRNQFVLVNVSLATLLLVYIALIGQIKIYGFMSYLGIIIVSLTQINIKVAIRKT